MVNGRSTFGGSVQIVQGGSASIAKARINGDILFDDNVGPLVADANVLGGSLQAFQNTGGVTLTLNRMKGNLQCKENEPAPTGGGNKAASKEDQCSRCDGLSGIDPSPASPVRAALPAFRRSPPAGTGLDRHSPPFDRRPAASPTTPPRTRP